MDRIGKMVAVFRQEFDLWHSRTNVETKRYEAVRYKRPNDAADAEVYGLDSDRLKSAQEFNDMRHRAAIRKVLDALRDEGAVV